ncbi:MAG: peptide chain release factor N(5)-glutamine methyltransferase [Selenomonadaceae bacterium]|nr:peptide chain release factor N(5)-glutamine methyltransferase [Selenomonadaceae bacterium]
MTKSVFEVLKSATERLDAKKIDSPRLDAEILLAHVLNCRRLDFYIDADKILPLESILRFNELINRRLEGIPVAYLTGTREFMGLKFSVNENVLIPRPDTEILTEFVGEFLRSIGGGFFADLGTGSGAICISILKFVKNVRACAVDISENALDVAKFNAQKFHVDDRAEFFCGNLFDPLEGKIFDAIVSNPPYIPTNDLKTLQTEVQTEPKLALDGGNDGLDFYRRIISDAPKFLRDGGLLAVEIGINQASAVKNLFERANFVDIEILNDLSGIERVIFGFKSSVIDQI